MSLLDELGFQQIDPDTQGIVDLDMLDLSVDIEVTTLNSHLGMGMEDIKPVDATFPEIFLQHASHDQGIVATDVGSLLEQFEEKASQNVPVEEVAVSKSEEQTYTVNSEPNNNGDVKDKNVVSQPDTKFLTKEFLERIQRLRAEKKKAAVMLPMVVPAKRGRGRAMTRGHPVALPASCTPLRLQRVMMQNQDLREHVPFSENSSSITGWRAGDVNDKDVLDENNEITNKSLEVFIDHDYIRKENNPPHNHLESNDLDLEEGEVIEDEESLCLDIKPDKAKLDRRMKRRGNSPDLLDDSSQYFDKLPSYCTALSIPHKQTRKTAANVTRRGGLRLHDYIARDNSPVRDTTDSAYNRIPNYYFSFTNSTKYDSLNIDTCKINDDTNSGKDSSGYSSLCPSVQDSDSSPTRSRSSSHSRSRSQSVSQGGQSPSRQFNRRSRKGTYRRQSSCSPCSVRSNSSSCSRSSCSGCASRSPSRGSSVSRSGSCSSCCSRSSSSSRSRSRGRSWQRERDFRAQRVNRSRSHSRGRARRNSSKLSDFSRSRSRDFRSRSRSCSPAREKARRQSRERRREAKKQEREEEKEKQMKERRIVYVGGLPSNYTRHKLRNAFTRFGEIEHVQLHFREHGDNYGFVTFMYTCDAYAAIEKGKYLPELKDFDLCFGGRRQFCDVEYADLDGNKEVEEEYDPNPRKHAVLDFDELLRQARAGIKK